MRKFFCKLEEDGPILNITTKIKEWWYKIRKVSFQAYHFDLNTGETSMNPLTIFPVWGDKQKLYWESSNPCVVVVNRQTGKFRAIRPGMVTITVTDGANITTSFSVWVHGNTPVILIHGKGGSSLTTWGANNEITVNSLNPADKDNNHFIPKIHGKSINERESYIDKDTREIREHTLNIPIRVNEKILPHFTIFEIVNGEYKDGCYTEQHSKGGNLAYYLKTRGYKENVTLFAFNYPQEDTIADGANKLKAYINDLIRYVRATEDDEIKACFYKSRADYETNNFQIHLVGHGMGGLIARYYIENWKYHKHVEKLITINTPHWGCKDKYVLDPNGTLAKPCDYDLHRDSAMYGNNTAFANDGCPYPLLISLGNSYYFLTEELEHTTRRETQYYAIAGITCAQLDNDLKEYAVELPANFAEQNEIMQYINAGIDVLSLVDIKNADDSAVGLLSQIGVNERFGVDLPKIIDMKKIFIYVGLNDDVEDNGFHETAPHRLAVIQQVFQYLHD